MYCPESFICLQEALHVQVTSILNALNDESEPSSQVSGANDHKAWEYIGVGREDGEESGEYSPIFFRPSIYKLLSFKNLWLSQTPHKPSIGWDAACTRILTIGIFQHRATLRLIVAMNTHMDHVGTVARLEGAKLIVREVDEAIGLVNRITDPYQASAPRGAPVFLAGDFNSESSQEAYKVLNGKDSPVYDLRDSIPEHSRYGHKKTFTGFQSKERQTRIDFIFLAKNSPWEPKMYSIQENRFEDGIYCSDHRAVVGDVVLLPESSETV